MPQIHDSVALRLGGNQGRTAHLQKSNLRIRTSDIMVTPKLGVLSILSWNFIIQKHEYSERVNQLNKFYPSSERDVNNPWLL